MRNGSYTSLPLPNEPINKVTMMARDGGRGWTQKHGFPLMEDGLAITAIDYQICQQ